MDTAASHALSALSDAAAAASPAEHHEHDASHHAPRDSTAGVPGIVKSEGGQAAMKGDEASKDSIMDTSTSTSSRSPRPQQPATPASTVASAPALPAAAGTARSELVNGPSHEKHSSEQQAVYNNSMHSAHASNSVASGSIPLKAASLSHPAPNGSPASSSSISASQGSPGNPTAPSSGLLAGGNNTLKRPFSRVDVLLEAAASPDASAPPQAKQSKTKKSPKPSSSSGNTTIKQAASTSNLPLTSLNGSSGTSTSSANTNGTKKSAYQGPKISMACYSCRTSKTRCSGTQPCNRCDLKRMDCHYPLRDGRTANRKFAEPLLEDSASLPLSSTYDNGPMQRFNQAFALQTNATRNNHGLPPIPSSVNPSSAKLPPPSVFAHQTPARTPATESTPAPSSLPSQHQFPRPPQSTQAAQRNSPNSQEPLDTVGYRPSSGTSTSGSTTSRTHTSLPLNGTKQSTSRSPEEIHYVSTVADPQARLSASHPHSYANGPPSSSASGRPATAGAGVSVKSFHLSTNGDQNTANGRDRSHSFPHPVPAHLKDYVLPLPPLMGSTPTSPVPPAMKGVNEDEHEPERFLEGTSKMRDSNALQLKEHRRPPNAHPESSAFGESEPVYKPQTQGLPYPSSTAYLPFSYSAHYPSRWSPLHSSLQSHHLRTNPVAAVSKHVKQESEEASPKIDELSSSSATFERSEMTEAPSETDARDTISRTSPPSTAGTSLSSSLHPSYTHGSKVDTPGSNPNLVGPAYLHSNNMLPPILGCRALPDTLLPWKALLSQAGIPDLETLKAEIPFEAVKRYVDCLAESWPDVLPTFTKRFQLRYAIEDALTRACRDTPTKISQY